MKVKHLTLFTNPDSTDMTEVSLLMDDPKVTWHH